METAGAIHVQSIPAGNVHVACFAPRKAGHTGDAGATACGDAQLILERYAATSQTVSAAIRFLPSTPHPALRTPHSNDLVLLTNGIGGMARLCVDLGRVNSKYDCVARRQFEPGLSGGPPRFRQAPPRLGERRRLSLAAGFQKPRVVPSRPARRLAILSPAPATAARWKSNCAPKWSRAKTRRFFSSAARRTNARPANNCPPTPTCA